MDIKQPPIHEAIISEVFRIMRPTDIKIDSLEQKAGAGWLVNGSVEKYGGQIKIQFSFSFERS